MSQYNIGDINNAAVVASQLGPRAWVRSHSAQHSSVSAVFAWQQTQCVSGGNCLSRYIVRNWSARLMNVVAWPESRLSSLSLGIFTCLPQRQGTTVPALEAAMGS